MFIIIITAMIIFNFTIIIFYLELLFLTSWIIFGCEREATNRMNFCFGILPFLLFLLFLVLLSFCVTFVTLACNNVDFRFLQTKQRINELNERCALRSPQTVLLYSNDILQCNRREGEEITRLGAKQLVYRESPYLLFGFCTFAYREKKIEKKHTRRQLSFYL